MLNIDVWHVPVFVKLFIDATDVVFKLSNGATRGFQYCPYGPMTSPTSSAILKMSIGNHGESDDDIGGINGDLDEYS